MERWGNCAILYLFSERRAFVENVARWNAPTLAHAQPPWIAFPAMSPFTGWSAVIEGAWLREVFIPLWRRMSDAEREEFWERYPAPPSWNGWEDSVTWDFLKTPTVLVENEVGEATDVSTSKDDGRSPDRDEGSE
jgi:hypothetical protein